MKHHFHLSHCPCTLNVEATPADQSQADLPYIFLDLGYPDRPQPDRSPSIVCRRTEAGDGWVIIIHPDGQDDPSHRVTILDSHTEAMPVITIEPE